MSDFQKIEELLEKSNAKLGEKFDQVNQELVKGEDVTKKLRDEVKSLSEENAELKEEHVKMAQDLLDLQQSGAKMEEQREAEKSVGEIITDADSFKNFVKGETDKARIEIKNTVLGETAGTPTNDVAPLQTMQGIVGGTFRQLRLLDIMSRGTATSNTIHYTRELLFVNNAAEVAEGAAAPETDITFEPQDIPVRNIAHTIKVSKQILDDAPALQTYLNTRMRYGTMLRVENQILNGNGTGQNLKGMLHADNHTPYVDAGTGVTDIDYASQMKYAMIAGEYMADYFLINPADWGAIERLKKTDGGYVAGAVSTHIANGMVTTLWGLPVVASNTVPAGRLVTGSINAAMYWERQGTTVEMFNQNEDDVNKGLLTIRSETRGAMTGIRPAAILSGLFDAT